MQYNPNIIVLQSMSIKMYKNKVISYVFKQIQVDTISFQRPGFGPFSEVV